MQLSQSALFRLFCASFLAGIVLSLLSDVLYTMRIFLMPSNARYTVLSIRKLYQKRIKTESEKKQKKGLRVAVFIGDVLLCLVSAITLILLLYWLNNGAFRAAAPLCMAVGFFLAHKSISVGVRIMLEWIAFGIETALYILVLPIKRLFGMIAAVYKKYAQRKHVQHLARARQTYTKQELQNIERAASRLLPIYSKPKRKVKGDRRAKQRSKKTV